MELRFVPDAHRYPRMTTDELRAGYLVENLFKQGDITLTLTDLDRGVVGSAVPTKSPLDLPCPEDLRADNFCARRELGILNIGSPGSVSVDGTDYDLAPRDMLYVGRGAKKVSFSSAKADDPAKFYLVSFPAHTDHPTTKVTQDQARPVNLGEDAQCNRRTIFQYIHPDGAQSCQLVMGWTEVYPSNVWNTLPAHTHLRRCEFYMYFDLDEGHQVLHMMGQPNETRALWMANHHCALSPPWSIHCGAGSTNYRFAWAMGGENQDFGDMDGIPIANLR